MKQKSIILGCTLLGLLVQFMLYYYHNPKKVALSANTAIMESTSNPVVYFEIPVNDMDRAISFYQEVFQFDFEKERIDNNEMALFPFSESQSGISGALAKGEIYKPTKAGILIYFQTADIDNTLERANTYGGQTLYPKTDNGIGFVAEFEDTEGNRIALFQAYE